MDDLLSFLRARLDEREVNASDRHTADCDSAVVPFASCDCGEPTWILDDVEAKRQLIEFWSQAFSEPADFPGPAFDRVRSSARWTLKKLAQPFDDHSGYQGSWKP